MSQYLRVRLLAARAVFIVVVLTGWVVSGHAGERVGLGPASTGLAWDGGGRGGEETITVTVSEVLVDGIAIDGRTWAVVQIPEGHNLMRRGEPSLPFLATELLLGDDDRVELELVDATIREIDLGAMGFAGVAPSKGHFDRNVDPETVPWVFDEKLYGSEHPYPALLAREGDPFIAGPLRGQGVELQVVRWTPSTNVLTVLERATFRVVHEPDHVNPRTRKAPPMTGLFARLARERAVNGAEFLARYAPFVEVGRLLILAYDDFADEVEPLAEWEELVGYPTLLVHLSDVPHAASVPTATEIKSFIQGLYDENEGLTWIILVGDYQQIPNLQGAFTGQNIPCDACYTKLEGNDNRPDAAISRLSAQSGAQVTVQVNKILAYEQNPDTGSAAAWYSKAFGIGGDDTGSTQYADWERMDLLRKDLVTLGLDPDEPHYTYTEFTTLYHSPSSQSVGDTVDDGRGLGLYIGHGSETHWVTSGFSVDDVHDLTNGNMLPVIWDVACVNGAFQALNECFAESWLRKENGGAVSFEAATTNESWVPPCDAQRGIVDALRNETAFTTGGQHVDGKLYCMDVNGDQDSDEGTKFMEQSTLFGSCVTWPRTVPPVAPDEPDDFALSGGVASLTVKVGGAPYTKEHGAIVSFSTEGTNGPIVLGSGLIGADGVVHAQVSGTPTHCHIHGFNLVPASFELAARPEGSVDLDRDAYACTGHAGIRVADSNVPGSSDAVVDTVTVTVSAPGGSVDVTLTEEGADRNAYSGGLDLGTDLTVQHGDTLTVTYVDADDGSGGTNIDRTDTAAIDCTGPVISNVQASATHESMTITFDTDEPGTTTILWGTTRPPTQTTDDSTLVTAHSVTLTGLAPCTRYFFEIVTEDAQGNQTVDDNGGAFYSGVTSGWTVIASETLDADPGWATTGDWAFGAPAGSNDPHAGATGSSVYGYNNTVTDNGNYANNMSEEYLTTPDFDVSDATSLELRFQRQLGVESSTYDHAAVEISADGGSSWTRVWDHSGATVNESSWSEQTIDLGPYLPAATLRVRWVMGPTDASLAYKGWNIDDIRLEGSTPCCSDAPAWPSGSDGVDSVAEVNTGGSCQLGGLDVDWSPAVSTCANDIRYDLWVVKGSTVDFNQSATFSELSGTHRRVMGLTPGQQYAVAVRAVDEFGNMDANTHVLTATPSGAVSGDVNGDSAVDSSDVQALLAYFFSGTTPAGEGDVDCSGRIDASDLAREVEYRSNGLY